MSQSGAPSAWRIAMDGWRMGWRAGGRMPWLLATSIIAWLLLEAMDSIENGGGAWLWHTVRSIADACIGASAAIAVHHFVLLGETSDRPVWRAPAQFGAYMGYTALLYGIAWMPGQIGPRPGFEPWEWLEFGLLLIAALLGPFFELIFPATAIDAPGRGLFNCWNDAQGHYWRIVRILLSLLLVTFVWVVPRYVLLALVLRLAGLPEWQAFLQHLIPLGYLFAYPQAAAFALLYSHVANELRGPSAPPRPAITDRD